MTSTPRNYLLTLLMLIMVFNYVDRIAMGLLLQGIKVDLSLSDTQLGFLTGIAFAGFYATMGIPIARWAVVVIGSRSSRPRLDCGVLPWRSVDWRQTFCSFG